MKRDRCKKLGQRKADMEGRRESGRDKGWADIQKNGEKVIDGTRVA